MCDGCGKIEELTNGWQVVKWKRGCDGIYYTSAKCAGEVVERMREMMSDEID